MSEVGALVRGGALGLLVSPTALEVFCSCSAFTIIVSIETVWDFTGFQNVGIVFSQDMQMNTRIVEYLCSWGSLEHVTHPS